jgi:aminopeptidase-like protein
MSNNTKAKVGTGAKMYRWAQALFPVHRSITGAGVRETLAYLGNLLPGLLIHAVPSGTQAFDWTVPDEWTIRDAYIADEAGNKVVDYTKHNLHVVGYSEPVDTWLSLNELDEHLYSLPEQPDAIPYVTSYYNRHWGFCLPHRQRENLPAGRYHAVIDSDLQPGVLNYGELVLPGQEDSEVLLSTYICHPSMANNELSGPVVTAALVQWLQSLENRRFTYRIVFVPETVGAIVYLSKNSAHMKLKTIAGFEISCVGDDRAYSFLPSRKGGTLADRVAEQTLKQHGVDYARYSFLDRGADERQYCSALIDLPVVLVMRSKYGSYPEYHTSLDDLSVISPAGLEGAFNILQCCVLALEANYVYRATIPCEPQLGRRGIKPTLSTKNVVVPRTLMNVLAYADGQTDLLAISEIIGVDVMECAAAAVRLEQEGLLEKVAL